jgi:hypothetical protein
MLLIAFPYPLGRDCTNSEDKSEVAGVTPPVDGVADGSATQFGNLERPLNEAVTTALTVEPIMPRATVMR